ncbi:hypothetical protein [Tautonia plasticadhaerens]|uniref:hypothetical protein n=1 Tax=Tautonia plasticadhaerens TaxID=2527974 RepID=UPI0011A47C85|nr:hypothetical protein [Tautonia plasticadhaerens]
MTRITTPDPGDAEVRDRILQAIAGGPTAWLTPEELSFLIGLDRDETLDAVASMDLEGQLDIWERPEGIVVTLSALSAVRLGVHLVELGPKQVLRWAREGDPEPAAPRSTHVVRDPSSASFAFLVDPGPGPEALADTSHQAERYHRSPARAKVVCRSEERAAPPRPTRLIGTGLIPWPGPSIDSEVPCPACGPDPLPPNAYCLCCDRWGLDDAEPAPARKAASSRGPGNDGFLDPDRLTEQDAIERRQRKERRTARLSLRFERQRRERPHGSGRRRNAPA